MISPGVIGAIAGFLAALATIGVPLLKILYETRRKSERCVRLLEGDDEIDGDGLIPRVRSVERAVRENAKTVGNEELADEVGR
jgi:hypothetical protein